MVSLLCGSSHAGSLRLKLGTNTSKPMWYIIYRKFSINIRVPPPIRATPLFHDCHHTLKTLQGLVMYSKLYHPIQIVNVSGPPNIKYNNPFRLVIELNILLVFICFSLFYFYFLLLFNKMRKNAEKVATPTPLSEASITVRTSERFFLCVQTFMNYACLFPTKPTITKSTGKWLLSL